MKTLFYVLLILQGILEIYMAVQFARMKNTALARNCVYPFIFYALLFLACFLLRLSIPYYAYILALITIFIDTFVGYYLDYYRKSQTFDRYLHAFGTFSNALLFYHILKRLLLFTGSRLFTAVFVLLVGLSVGVLFELLEFASDKLKRTHNQRSLQDTNFDLLFNFLGSLLAFLFAYSFL